MPDGPGSRKTKARGDARPGGGRRRVSGRCGIGDLSGRRAARPAPRSGTRGPHLGNVVADGANGVAKPALSRAVTVRGPAAASTAAATIGNVTFRMAAFGFVPPARARRRTAQRCARKRTCSGSRGRPGFHLSVLRMVGDLGIEPSMRLREGVTVPCHTLRPVAHLTMPSSACRGRIAAWPRTVKRECGAGFRLRKGMAGK